MGDKAGVSPKRRVGVSPGEADGLRARIVGDAPVVFVTLVSVLVGLVLTDLVTEARGRMRLWPLDLRVMLTWAQLAATGTAAVSVWMVIAHLGITRRRMPQLSEGLACLGPPLLLLTANTFVGREQAWPWFYGASIYLVACSTAFAVLVRQAMDQPGGSRFSRLLRPQGCLSILVGGVPAYLVIAMLDQAGRFGGAVELALTLSTIPASFIVDWMFFRDLNIALGSGTPAEGAERQDGAVSRRAG